MAKSAIKTSKIVKSFLDNLYKIDDALKDHDEFEYDVVIVAMDGKRAITVDLEDMEKYGELFLVEVTFKSYWLTYVLTFGDSDFSIRSRFMFRRNHELSFSYIEMFSVLNISEFRDVEFSFVLDENVIESVLARVADFAKSYVGIFIDTYKYNWTILESLEEQQNEWIYLESLRMKKKKIRRQFNSAFKAYQDGDFIKAVDKYGSLRPWLTKYELMRFEYINEISRGEKKDFRKRSGHIPHVGYKVLKEMRRKSFLDFIVLCIGCLLATAIVSLIFIAVYYGFLGLQSEYIFILISGIDMVFVPAFFIGIIGALIPRKYFLRVILKENFEKYIAVDTFSNGKFNRKILPIINGLVIATAVIFMVITLNWNIKFENDRLLDNSKYFSIKPRVIMYSEIKAIYKEEKYRNSFNEVRNAPSYFIMLNNGELLDLRILMYDMEGFEEVALPYLNSKVGIPLRKIELKEKLENEYVAGGRFVCHVKKNKVK